MVESSRHPPTPEAPLPPKAGCHGPGCRAGCGRAEAPVETAPQPSSSLCQLCISRSGGPQVSARDPDLRQLESGEVLGSRLPNGSATSRAGESPTLRCREHGDPQPRSGTGGSGREHARGHRVSSIGGVAEDGHQEIRDHGTQRGERWLRV